jgi:hypothetical protein
MTDFGIVKDREALKMLLASKSIIILYIHCINKLGLKSISYNPGTWIMG